MDDKQRIEGLEMEVQRLGHGYRQVAEELERIKPVYHRLCRSPLFWFIRPLDAELDGRELMKCNCGGHFWMGRDTEFTTHSGHIYKRALDTSVWVYLKARYMPRLIK